MNRSPNTEGEVLGALIGHVDQRVERLEQSIPDRIENALNNALDGRMLSDDERRWVRMAIASEAKRIEFRQAVIEKTFTALVWAALAGLGAVVWRLATDWVKTHFWFNL